MKVSYFPGCTLRTKAKELDAYARKSAAFIRTRPACRAKQRKTLGNGVLSLS